jgi:hypothetical protein
MKIPTEAEIQSTKDKYLGKTIKIIEMKGEPKYSGKTGVCDHVDDLCQLSGSWGGLRLQPENGNFVVVE